MRLQRSLEKASTGIPGLDEVLGGGLPRGRNILLCGGPGCGKTLVGIAFLISGARDHGEPGVLISFQESPEELVQNVTSLGWDLGALVDENRIYVQQITVRPYDFVETGAYDLSGLRAQIEYALDSVGARRVVLDAPEDVFVGFQNEGVLRSEMVRLFDWLKGRGLTSVVTVEQGQGGLTRHGLEEYVSDCVIHLDNRIHDQVSTRRLRIVKYRGSSHGNDEFPFLISESGITVFPVTTVQLDYEVAAERISTGVKDLDAMMDGKGYYKGSNVIISGSAGTGKSSLCAHFVDATCRRGEHALYVSTEEAASQIVRNMASIGLDLGRWQERGLLEFHTVRPSQYGLEMHLETIRHRVRELRPEAVVLDPVSSYSPVGTFIQIRSMLSRLTDDLHRLGATTIMTNLTAEDARPQAMLGISSVTDTWITLRPAEQHGDRITELLIVKSRGMAHSRRIRELQLTDWGIELVDA